MSLRFLARRRDRDRDCDRDCDRSTNTSSSLDSKAPSSRLVLPHDPIGRGKSAVPAEVQIISWDPNDLEASGREVHIRSRARDTSTAAPVYHAFTASSVRRGSDALTPPEPSSSSSNSSSGHTASTQQVIVTNTASKPRPRTAPRSYHRQWVDSRSFFDAAPSATVPSTLVDTPRSEDVEVLEPTWPSPNAQEQQTQPIRLASNTRRAKARSHHSTGAAYDALTIAEEAATHPYSGLPSSMPSTSRSPFASIHRNASVASLASLLSLGGGCNDTSGSASTEMSKSASSTPSAFLSRIPSTRRLRRSKNASSADIQLSASPAECSSSASRIVSLRSRSSSLSSLAPKFLQALSIPAGKIKPSRGAPPSAWRSDIAGTAADGASSTYSSDNDGSSHGHIQESSSTIGQILNKVAVSAHVRKASADTSNKHASAQLLSPLPHTNGAASPRTPASFSNRLHETDSSSPLLASSITAVESPIISGLPLPDPTAASISSLFNAQLFKRLGPPPVGLEPHRFEERVALIQSYVQSQLPPPPCPKSPLTHPAQRSSLPPPPPSMYSVAALEDEFDKLECLAEVEMATLAPAEGGIGLEKLRLEEAFLEARRRSGVDWSRSHFELSSLATAVGAAAGSPRMRDGALTAAGLGLSASGLGLAAKSKVGGGENGGGGLGVSLKPAPRSRRRPVTASAAGVGGGRGRRPTTAPETQQYDGAMRGLEAKERFNMVHMEEEAVARPVTGRPGSALEDVSEDSATVATGTQGELFTPQSFSSRPPLPSTTTTAAAFSDLNTTQPSAVAAPTASTARLHSPLSPLPPLPTHTPPPSSYPLTSASSNKLRRGSSDRDSSSSHTHRSNSSAGTGASSRSLFWNHSHYHPSRVGGVLWSNRHEAGEGEGEGEGEDTEDTASCESLVDAEKISAQDGQIGW